MKKIVCAVTLALVMLVHAGAFAEIPAGYYTSLTGKKDADLKTAICNLVSKFTLVSSYQDLPSYFRRTDVRPGTNLWWDMYSDIPLRTSTFSGLNREHSFPKSWWGGSTSVTAYVDLNHLYPSEAAANQAKSNYPLGEVDRAYSPSFDNGITVVGYPKQGQGGGAKYVFEPDDEYKGDFARTYFYMVTCYQNLTWRYTYMVNQNLYPTLNNWSIDLLMKWHRDDPVSDKETNRNDVVYSIQNNRNPFIDYPELAEYLWGNRKGQTFNPGSVTPPVGEANLITPTRGMSVDFGQVALGGTATSKLFFHGENLRGALDLVLSLNDKAMFSLPSNSINASLVNSEDGYWLTITYKPTALGTHTTKLYISEGGIQGSRGVDLRGECLPVPTLTACTATEPINIENDRYTATWTYPSNETIDYYVVTRTCYSGGKTTVEELLAEENFCEITGFDQSDSESYSVQSVRLGHRSPMSNVVFVNHAGVSGVETEQPLVVLGMEGFIRFQCSAPQTGCRIFDLAGREIVAIGEVEHNTDIDLPLGVYLVTTNEHRTPVKVAVR